MPAFSSLGLFSTWIYNKAMGYTDKLKINTDKCVGCGICTTKCQFGAITLKKVRDDKGGPYFSTLGKVGVNAVKRYSKVAVKKVARPIAKIADKE